MVSYLIVTFVEITGDWKMKKLFGIVENISFLNRVEVYAMVTNVAVYILPHSGILRIVKKKRILCFSWTLELGNL